MEVIKKKKTKNIHGFSLVEILVVLSVFAILGIVVSQSLLLILRGARKSDTSSKVRQSLDFAINSMERQIHNATNLTPCPNTDTTTITVVDQDRQTYSLSCSSIGPTGFVASASSRLTSTDISVTACSFTCTPATASVPPFIKIDITAQDSQAVGPENTKITDSRTIYLRSY